jgi:hypothetical protein
MKDTSIVVVGTVGGALLAGHGAPTLFGVFGGPGLCGTAAGIGDAGLEARVHCGTAAKLSEFDLCYVHALNGVALKTRC